MKEPNVASEVKPNDEATVQVSLVIHMQKQNGYNNDA